MKQTQFLTLHSEAQLKLVELHSVWLTVTKSRHTIWAGMYRLEMHTDFRQKALRRKSFVGALVLDVSMILETWGAGGGWTELYDMSNYRLQVTDHHRRAVTTFPSVMVTSVPLAGLPVGCIVNSVIPQCHVITTCIVLSRILCVVGIPRIACGQRQRLKLYVV
jgi:hypothetical protein